MNEFYEDLIEAGWNILHDYPGIDKKKWIDLLCRIYPLEVTDAFGGGSDKYYSERFNALWNETYRDELSGLEMSLKSWSQYFSDSKAVEDYELMENALASNKAL